MDSYGDHLLCCNKAEFYSRHQAVVKCLTTFLAAAGLRVANEVQVEGRERPADIFVPVQFVLYGSISFQQPLQLLVLLDPKPRI